MGKTCEEMTYATVLADSISPWGKRLTSIEYCAPRFILSEINTHCSIAKNARSSRAVPVATMLQEVRVNPFMPHVWLKNKPGMQGGDPMTDREIEGAKARWLAAAERAAFNAEDLAASCNVHKQWANRGLEPYLYVYGVLTATDWNNFDALRISEYAQPEFDLLARKIKEARDASTPTLLPPGQWHLPYVDITGKDCTLLHGYIARTFGFIDNPKTHGSLLYDVAKKVSAARVARVSYKPFDGDASIEKELERASKLMDSNPKHMSPFQHQATPDVPANFLYRKVLKVKQWKQQEKNAHFKGWIPYRMTIAGEHVEG